jgi:hypothetical protein
VKQKSDVNQSEKRRIKMKKLAFILAIVFVFLIGEKIVFVHKIWAGEKPTPRIVFQIPVNENGEFVLEKVKGVKELKDMKDMPINVESWKTIKNIKTAVIIHYTNDPYCYLVYSEGRWFQRCINLK